MADQRDSTEQSGQEQGGEKRVVGRGMTSPDSTEAVLYASTGEPDPRARGTGDKSTEDAGDESEKGETGER